MQAMCRVLEVKRSGYYAWRRRPPSARALANQRLVTQMRVIHGEVQKTYGSPRMQAELVARGLPCNVKRVARLMRLHHLRARHKRRYRVTTKVNPKLPVAPNHLAQHFQASAPNEKWVGDITYLWTREGWLYLAVVMDLYSRRIVGWAVASTQDTTLVPAALQMAIGRRQPPAGLLHHSDRGSQYASAQYQAVLQAHRFTVSMSGAGNCFGCFRDLCDQDVSSQQSAARADFGGNVACHAAAGRERARHDSERRSHERFWVRLAVALRRRTGANHGQFRFQKAGGTPRAEAASINLPQPRRKPPASSPGNAVEGAFPVVGVAIGL